MQVTLFAYSDLLLFTKEDEPGRCNVLRNPLYLQSVKLQEGECLPETPWTASALAESFSWSGQHGWMGCGQALPVDLALSHWCCSLGWQSPL